MTGLDSWLKQATRHLSKDSAVQVRTEIEEHYESAREAAISGGATIDEAHRLALTALGNAKTANCQYRHVLLTSAEARMLRDGEWEARVVCSRSWLKWLLVAAPVAAVLGGCRTVPDRRIRAGAGGARWGNRAESVVCGATPARLHPLAQSRLPPCEMGGADWHARAGLRAGRAQMVLADDFMPMAYSLDRMDAGFDPAEVACREMAQAVIPLTQA